MGVGCLLVLTLKSDQESSLEGLLNIVKQQRGEDITVEASAAYDKQSKGEVKYAVQEVQGKVRTLKYALESRIGRKIDPGADYFAWMVSHASLLLNVYHRGDDGRTPWERRKG